MEALREPSPLSSLSEENATTNSPGKKQNSSTTLRQGSDVQITQAQDIASEEREVWPSRLAFVLAGMGAAIGVGNLLRYPSIAFANWGAQWFIPYLIALFLIGIPLVLLEIAIGQAYRGGSVLALGRVNPRLRGVGMSSVYMSFIVSSYFNIIMAWVFVYFRNSFIQPLPWEGRADQFFNDEVVQNPEPERDQDGRVVAYETGMVWETFGWSAVVWVAVFICIFRGVSMTGKIVYVTMLLPLMMLVVIVVRGVTLPNAWNGIRLYIGTFRPELLADGKIWQKAIGQIFFSVGPGFGIFTAYASYNSRHQDAVQDAIIITCANSCFEMTAGLAAFGIVGYLNLPLDSKMSAFTLGFYTYPAALSQLPGANVWSVVFFGTLLLLGIDSSFAYTEAFVTALIDAPWAKKYPRWTVCFAVCLVGIALGALHSSKFGMAIMDSVDLYLNELTLLLITWSEAVSVNTIYRWRDVQSQCGTPGVLLFNMGYIGAQVVGCVVGHVVGFRAGILVGLFTGLAGMSVGVLVSETPSVIGPWGGNTYVNRSWWLSSYSGNQLRRDLNVFVSAGGKTSIPSFWAPLLKWFTAPVLMVILSFVFPKIVENAGTDPLYAVGLGTAVFGALLTILGFVSRRFSLPFLPDGELDKWRLQYSAGPNKTVSEPADIHGPLKVDV